MTIELANRLTAYRKKAGLSQEQLAEKLGVSRQAVSKWERAEASPDTDNLIELAKLYDVSLDTLIGHNPSNKEPEQEVVDEDFDNNEFFENVKNAEIKIEDGEDKVKITPFGINVKSKSGEKVYIGVRGIHVSNNDIENDEISIVGDALTGIWIFAITLFYILFGFLYEGTLGTTEVNAWAAMWPVFIFIPVLPTFVTAIRHKRVCDFAYVLVITGVYCFMGMLYNMWHPWWALFLTIPIYYIIGDAIDKKTHHSKD